MKPDGSSRYIYKQWYRYRYLRSGSRDVLHGQAVLYHGHACAALGEHATLELCDWACRQLTRLNAAGRRYADAPGACLYVSVETAMSASVTSVCC